MLTSFFDAIWSGFSNHTGVIIIGFIAIWLILIALYLLGAVMISATRKYFVAGLGGVSVVISAVGMQVMGIITPVYLVLVFISWILRLAS